MNKKIVLPVGAILLLLLAWAFLGGNTGDESALFVSPSQGDFQVAVTTTGELRAKNSTQIMGPRGARDIQLYNLRIQNLIPEGTVVEPGDFVAELDRSEIMTRLQTAQLQVESVESQFEQAQLDSTLTLTQARNNLENLVFQVEEREIAVEQSIYESPAVQRQAEIELLRVRRELEQERENYDTRVRQATARLREIETELTKERNSLGQIREVMNGFTIHAPERGMVIYNRLWNGQKTTTGSTINSFSPVVAELPDFTTMESVTYVNEVDIQQIRRNQDVKLGLDAIRDKELSGVVTSVANIGEQRPNSDSKVFEVIIEVNESDTTLRPAMTTSNEIFVETVPSAIYLPLETIHTYDATNYVFTQSGSQMVMQQVVLGPMNENDIVIREGVSLSDRVLITMPPDTAGVRRMMLPEDVLDRYREQEQEEVTEDEEADIVLQPGDVDWEQIPESERDSLRALMRERMGEQNPSAGRVPGGEGTVRTDRNVNR
ncbi:MAG: efflux RND transporter periplasmic adaptor subunit [Balneolaceae bacterium]